MAREMGSMEEFLNHRSTERSGEFLGNWKKNKKLNTFLHRRLLPIALWRHNVPRVVIRDNDDGEVTRRVWGNNVNCHEDESTLKGQYKRFDDGTRKHPPKRCGVCRLVATVDDMVEEGQLDWRAPIFRFTADDPKETRVIHAGGLCNLFGGDLSDKEKRELKESGIYLSDAWQENFFAKLNYVMAIVVPDDEETGIQIAIETGLLGDKVKEVIGGTIESLGPEKGNPQITPYCIQWEYREQEKEFNKKYKARRMEGILPSPDLMKLISGPKPDLTSVVAGHDQDSMRAVLEAACLVKNIPWDEIYKFEAKPPEPRKHSDMEDVGRVPEVGAVPFDDSEMLPCDFCGKQMRKDALKCPHCGAVPIVECDGCSKPMCIDLPKCPHCGREYQVVGEAKASVPVEEKKPEPAAEPPKTSGRRARRKRGAGDGPSDA